VTVQEPLEFFLCFGEGTRAIWEVRAYLRIAVQPVKRIDVPYLKMSKSQTLGFQDDHGNGEKRPNGLLRPPRHPSSEPAKSPKVCGGLNVRAQTRATAQILPEPPT